MKKATFIIFLIVLAGAISRFVIKNGETKPLQKPFESPASKSPVVKISQDSPQETKTSSDILNDIRRARQILEKKDAGYEIHEKNKKGKWEVKGFLVLLAVRHADKKIEIVSVDPKAGESQRGYTIEWSRPNGVNTDFTVVHPAGCVVLAIKRVVRAEDEFEEVIYTPYTPEIDCEILKDTGLAYLKRIIQMARAQLTQVNSVAYPERSVIESVPENLALVLAIIEHIDPGRMGNEEIKQLIDEVLVVIGANQGVAYRYSVSEANARGLFQFIPETYASIRKQYPEAGLRQNFVEGMKNHLNAAKASLLLFDSDLSCLKRKVKLQKDTKSLGRYLASAYNCGAKRTTKEIRLHKKFWEHKIPLETRLYLKKFSAVWNSLIGA